MHVIKPASSYEAVSENPARPPQQDRSRASFERMMNAAEALMSDRGSDDFTLLEVGRIGKVSIGSIYNRFKSKDELIHAVHARMIARLDEERKRLVMHIRARSETLEEMVYALIDELAEGLQRHAPLMRPMMLRAAHDRVIQDRGGQSYENTIETLSAELNEHVDAIQHPEPKRACRTAMHIAYAALARQLGFGMTERPNRSPEWARFKLDLAYMVLAFLSFRPSKISEKP